MSEALLELKKKAEKPATMSSLLALLEESGGKNDRTRYGYKLRYFKKHLELIFDLSENCHFSYAEIVAAINDDGVSFSLVYFKKLMAAEKTKRAKQKSTS